VDLKYPDEIHDLHSDYPLAAEKLKINKEMLSTEQIAMLETLERQNLINSGKNFIGPIKPKESESEKLVPNLMNKNNYIVHYSTLKLYLNLGLKITKVHRVLTFKQKPWLKTFIDFNTKKRAYATTEFEKSFFKLLNNSVFGKTMENVRGHRNVDIVDSRKKAEKLIAMPTFKNCTVFREDLIAIERRKTTINFNKPIYSGFCILDISKTLMYDFHYNFIKKNYPGEDSKLCFTDTDSFLYKLKTDNVYKDMLQHKEWFDFSEYSPDHACFIGMDKDKVEQIRMQNKKVVGKFKDELNGHAMKEFVGLRAKTYSFRYNESSEEVKKLKGIKHSVVKQEIQFKHYKSCLMDRVQYKAKMNVFKVEKHQVKSVCQNKTSLSCFDDKRYICADGINTIAYGHYRLNEIK
jgi:hypothetical protein